MGLFLGDDLSSVGEQDDVMLPGGAAGKKNRDEQQDGKKMFHRIQDVLIWCLFIPRLELFFKDRLALHRLEARGFELKSRCFTPST